MNGDEFNIFIKENIPNENLRNFLEIADKISKTVNTDPEILRGLFENLYMTAFHDGVINGEKIKEKFVEQEMKKCAMKLE